VLKKKNKTKNPPKQKHKQQNITKARLDTTELEVTAWKEARKKLLKIKMSCSPLRLVLLPVGKNTQR